MRTQSLPDVQPVGRSQLVALSGSSPTAASWWAMQAIASLLMSLLEEASNLPRAVDAGAIPVLVDLLGAPPPKVVELETPPITGGHASAQLPLDHVSHLCWPSMAAACGRHGSACTPSLAAGQQLVCPYGTARSVALPAACHTGLLPGRLGMQHVRDGGLRSWSMQHVPSSLCAGYSRGGTGSEQAALLQGVASAATGWLRLKLQKPRPVKGT